MLYILVTGDRRWDRPAVIGKVLRDIAADQEFVLIHGDARGADRIAAGIAARLMMRCEAFPADWDKYGRSAGPIRNRAMLNRLLKAKSKGHEVRVIAFHSDLSQSRGTADMVGRARKAELPVTVVKGFKPKPAQGSVVNIRRDRRWDVYIGRPSKWGNPFVLGVDGDRDEVLLKFETWLKLNRGLMADLPELRGKILGCFCKPEACHGDILVRLANG